jgi:hypothetical protein
MFCSQTEDIDIWAQRSIFSGVGWSFKCIRNALEIPQATEIMPLLWSWAAVLAANGLNNY